MSELDGQTDVAAIIDRLRSGPAAVFAAALAPWNHGATRL